MENVYSYRTLFRGTILSLIFITLYHFLVTSLAVVDLRIHTDSRTKFKIYYSDSSKSWSEQRVAAVMISPDRNHYSVRLANLKNISELRIDTSEKPATVEVQSLTISQPGWKPVRINSVEQFNRIKAGGGVEEFSVSKSGFMVKPASRDPNVYLSLPPHEKADPGLEQIFRILTIIGFAFALACASNSMFARLQIVPYAGLAVLVLIVVMASVSEYNKHPDEFVHVSAAKYYKNHNVPPKIDDPAIAHTYSIYGMSRLNSGEVSYFFAGKFGSFLEPLQLPDYLVFRYFNVALFALLVLGALYNSAFRILFVPMLLSPQIWYIFSYFNSEAFATVAILLIAYQMVVPTSAWNRLLSTDGESCRFWELIVIVLLLGLLLLLKINFYFFGLYMLLYFIWRLVFQKTSFTWKNMVRVAAVALAGICVFACVRGYHSYINDFQKSEKLLEAREKYAVEARKPSTPLEKKYVYLQMKDRGVTLKQILTTHMWGEKIFRTSFGEYGYTSVAASFNYYDFVRYLAITVLLVISAFAVKNGGIEGGTLLLITAGSAVLLMAGACWSAWTMDFQAQGRYLLPIVGMCSMFAYHMRQKLANLPCLFLLSGMFVVSLYSFIFVGLAGIDKVSFALG
jgi:hypothetical protein